MSLTKRIKKFFDKRKLKSDLGKALHEADGLVDTSRYPEALDKVARIEMKEGRYMDAADTWDAAAKHAEGWPSTHKGVAKMYADFAERTRERYKKESKKSVKGVLTTVIFGGAVIIGLYYLFSNVNITGVVISNLNGISSSFLINFILVGILGLMGYFYLK